MNSNLQSGRYEILGLLGTGATSRVDKARDTLIGRAVAVKTFGTGFGNGFEQQFLREAQMVGQLSHPSIVQLYDVGTNPDGTHYLVMEYVAGNTLEHLLTQSVVPLRRACAWAADLANALSLAHRAGIVHGDIKTGNILVTEDSKVKLGDFGIARFAAQISGSGNVLGTPAYLSPEQIQGEKQDQRSDLFSLGIVLYEMATGKRPFDGTSLPAVCAQILSTNVIPPSQHDPALPAAFDHIISRCLAKNPADRFQSSDELAQALYVLARADKPAPERPQASWLSGALQRRDVWACAGVLPVLALTFVGYRAIRHRLEIPRIPVLVSGLPKPPADLLTYSQTQIAATLEEAPAPTSEVLAVKKKVASRRLSASANPRPAGAAQTAIQFGPSKDLAPALPVAAPEAAPSPVHFGALNIDIHSNASDGTLAIFADQKLLYTTSLHSDGSDSPPQLQRELSPGPHQIRVALYRPDKSLQVEKEGLAEMHADATSTLWIRVNRRSKLLIRRETSLEVTWPSSYISGEEHTAPLSSSTASLK
jgi:Protein kinase domain